MKRLLFFLPLATALTWATGTPGTALPETNRTTDDEDTAAVEEMWEDEDSVIFEMDDDTALDSVLGTDEMSCLEPDYELMGECVEVSKSFRNAPGTQGEVTHDFSIYAPENYDKNQGWLTMMGRIIAASSMNRLQPDVEPLGKMMENRWKSDLNSYNSDLKSYLENADCKEIPETMTNAFRTSVMPAWRFGNGLTTYKVEEETYTGGAHGMNYTFCLTLADATGQPLGLKDVFKEECLPQVFELISEQLAARRTYELEENDAWDNKAETGSTADEQDGVMLAAGARETYGGKFYPRPALTGCGVLFTYAAYEKDCYAAGNVHIVLNYDDVKGLLKIQLP